MTVANGMYLVNKYNIVIPLPCYVVYIPLAGEYCGPGFCNYYKIIMIPQITLFTIEKK